MGLPTISELLSVKRITRIVDDIQDIRGTMLPAWADRVPSVDADESEIIAKITSKIVAADVIADNGKARVRSSEPIRLTSGPVPNLKHGLNINQEKLNLLYRLTNGGGTPGDLNSWDTYLVNSLASLLDGVRARRAALICAMLADDGAYDGFGIKWTGMSWGMPSALKVTLAGNRQWDPGNEATAKPLTDIKDIRNTARNTYGVVFDRLTMPEALLYYMVTTQEFKDMASVYQQISLPAGFNFSVLPTGQLKDYVAKILDMEIEIDDTVFFTEGEDGTQTSNRYFNSADVIFSVKALDGRGQAWDFANGVVTESLVGLLDGQSVVGGFSGPSRGPVGYSVGSKDLNPPDLTLWAVQRGFPRKHMETATARLRTT